MAWSSKNLKLAKNLIEILSDPFHKSNLMKILPNLTRQYIRFLIAVCAL